MNLVDYVFGPGELITFLNIYGIEKLFFFRHCAIFFENFLDCEILI